MKYQKLFLLATAAMLVAVNVVANPILSHKYTADPQPIIWNDRLYVYASNDDNSIVEADGYQIYDYTLVSTDDMVNWTDHGEVFNRSIMNWNYVYAPGAAVRGGKVYVYPCGAGGPVGVAVADRPEGPFRNGKVLVDRQGTNGCTNCNVPWMFDPHVFVDDDGQAYLYYGGGQDDLEKNPNGVKFGQNMRVIRLNDDMVSRKDNSATTVNAPRSFEAANMHKRGSTYYFSYVNNWDGGDGHPNAAIMYMTGTSPMGPFTLKGPVLRNPSIGGKNINRDNNNHHAAIEYPAGSDKWYMFYHDRRVGNAAGPNTSVNQRNISVDVLTYKSNGDMNEVTVTENGAPQIKNFNPYDTIRATTMNRQSGIKTASGGENSVGGMKLIDIDNNDWVRLKGVDFGTDGATKFVVRAASGSSGGSIELRTGSTNGTLLGTCAITGTGGWSTWRNFECDVNKSAATGVKDYLYLVFTGGNDMFDLSWYRFGGGAITDPDPDPDPCTPGEDCPNLVRDGNFSGTSLNADNWFIKNLDDGADATASVSDGKATINITGVGEQVYQPQLVQTGIYPLESGKTYTLSFKASAASARTIGIVLESNEWEAYTTKTFDLTTEERTFTHTFTMSTDDSDVQLAFNFGGTSSTANVTISEVNLSEGIMTSISGGRFASVNKTSARPVVSVRGRTLSVTSPNSSRLTIRMIDTRGKVVARFVGANSVRPQSFALTKIPAGRYFVEVKGAGVRQTLPVVVK